MKLALKLSPNQFRVVVLSYALDSILRQLLVMLLVGCQNTFCSRLHDVQASGTVHCTSVPYKLNRLMLLQLLHDSGSVPMSQLSDTLNDCILVQPLHDSGSVPTIPLLECEKKCCILVRFDQLSGNVHRNLLFPILKSWIAVRVVHQLSGNGPVNLLLFTANVCMFVQLEKLSCSGQSSSLYDTLNVCIFVHHDILSGIGHLIVFLFGWLNDVLLILNSVIPVSTPNDSGSVPLKFLAGSMICVTFQLSQYNHHRQFVGDVPHNQFTCDCSIGVSNVGNRFRSKFDPIPLTLSRKSANA